MKFLLDTCVVSDFVKGDMNTQQKLKSTPPQLICLSAISVMEIQYGLALNPARAKKLAPVLNGIIKSVRVLPFDNVTAEIAGDLRAELTKSGKPIGYYDILIAASAIEHDLILVTSNTKEFKRVVKLTIEDWR